MVQLSDDREHAPAYVGYIVGGRLVEPEWQERLSRGERWPPHMVETVRKITEREARQARRAETEAW